MHSSTTNVIVSGLSICCLCFLLWYETLFSLVFVIADLHSMHLDLAGMCLHYISRIRTRYLNTNLAVLQSWAHHDDCNTDNLVLRYLVDWGIEPGSSECLEAATLPLSCNFPCRVSLEVNQIPFDCIPILFQGQAIARTQIERERGIVKTRI